MLDNATLKKLASEFARKAVGVPFIEHGREYTGWDCWGLVVVGYREKLHIILPSFTQDYEKAVPTRAMSELIDNQRSGMKCWKQVVIPKAWDVVTLRIGGNVTHLGLMISSIEFLHAERNTRTVIESVPSPMWRQRVDGFWRHDLFH